MLVNNKEFALKPEIYCTQITCPFITSPQPSSSLNLLAHPFSSYVCYSLCSRRVNSPKIQSGQEKEKEQDMVGRGGGVYGSSSLMKEMPEGFSEESSKLQSLFASIRKAIGELASILNDKERG